MTETAQPSVERPAFPIPRTARGRGVRGVVAGTASVLAAMALLVTSVPSAWAAPAVQPVSTFGNVPALGLNMVNGAALHCPPGVTSWAPMIVPIEMALPRGTTNGTVDPLDVKNMPDDSSLWYRTLGNLQSGGTITLDKDWTQDGTHSIPITQTGLRSGTYLLGALCAIADKGRPTYPLDTDGNLIGEWFVLTFTWVDNAPEQGTFRFERQYAAPGSSAAPAPQPVTSVTPVVQASKHSSGGLGWPGWVAIAAAVGVVLAIGARLSRRRVPSRSGASDLPYPVPGAPGPRQFQEDE